MDFAKSFKAAHAVSTPLVMIRTFDNNATFNRIRAFWKDSAKADIPAMLAWDCVKGLTAKTDKGITILQTAIQNAGSTEELTAQLSETLRVSSKIADDTFIFLHNPQLNWSEASAIQGIWNLRDVFKAIGSMLVLLVPNGAILPSELSSDFLVLDEVLPTNEELAQVVNDTFKYAKLDPPSKELVTNATKALTGLPMFPAEQSTAMCLDVDSATLDVNALWERKRQTINQTRGLSVYTGKDKLSNVGGLANVKNFLMSVMTGKKSPNCIIFLDEIEKAFAGNGTDSSGVKTELTGLILSWMEDKGIKGILFNGIPGVGKSQLPKTLGNEFGIPFVNFNLSAMQDSLVGNSGMYLRNAMATVDAISDGKILAIATSNTLEALPPELQSRFQLGTFFFDTPNAEERDSIWNVYRKEFDIDSNESLPNAEGWTGREIKGCCEKSYMLGCSIVDAAKYVVPVTVSNASRIDVIRRNASGKYLSASHEGIYSFNGHSESTIDSVGTTRKIR